mgnify:CR=1 FL=1
MKTKKNSIWGQSFIDIAQSKGYIVKKPTAQQFKKFINFVIVGKGKNSNPEAVNLSLKNLKGGKNPKWVWVEIKNHEGQPGWLYGDSHFIVFELLDEYLFVSRKSLLDHIHSSVDFSLPLVQNTWEAKYKLYQRQGKLDQITQVKIKSLLDFKGNYTWKKNEIK